MLGGRQVVQGVARVLRRGRRRGCPPQQGAGGRGAALLVPRGRQDALDGERRRPLDGGLAGRRGLRRLWLLLLLLLLLLLVLVLVVAGGLAHHVDLRLRLVLVLVLPPQLFQAHVHALQR